MFGFKDIHPSAPVHVLLVPKKHIARLSEAQAADHSVLGKMMLVAPQVAREQGSVDGFRTIINDGRVGRQDVSPAHASCWAAPGRSGA